MLMTGDADYATTAADRQLVYDIDQGSGESLPGLVISLAVQTAPAIDGPR